MRELILMVLAFALVIVAIDTTIDVCTILWQHKKQEVLQKAYLRGFDDGVKKMLEKAQQIAEEYKKEKEAGK